MTYYNDIKSLSPRTFQNQANKQAVLHYNHNYGNISHISWVYLLIMVTQTNKLHAVVLSALHKVLKPVVRLMLAHDITLPTVIEMLKKVFIEVAEEDFSLPGKKTTDSRISVITGVHRKDVKRLRAVDLPAMETPKAISLGSKVINTWLTDPRWLNKDKSPKVLARNNDANNQLDFNDLAEQVSKDVRARAILDELIRVGAVTLLADDQIKLQTEGFIPSKGVEEKLYYFEQAAHDHLMAATQNIQGCEPPFLERIVRYQHIPEDKLAELRTTVNSVSNSALRKINDKAKQLSVPETKGTQRISFGVYFYNEKNQTDTDTK